MQGTKGLTGWRQSRLDALYTALQTAGEGGLTVKQAAEVLGVGKSMFVAGMLDQLVEWGYADVQRRHDLPRAPMVYTSKQKQSA